MSRRVQVEIGPGFVWEDPVSDHVVCCGDATDLDFIKSVVTAPADLVFVDPPYNLSKSERIVLAGRKSMFLDEDWDKYDDADYASLLSDIVGCAGDIAPSGNIWIWTSDWWISDVKRWLKGLNARVWPTYHWCKPNPAPSIRKANAQSAVEYIAMASRPGNFFDLDSLPKQKNYFVAFPDGEFVPSVVPYWVERSVVSQKERLKRKGSKEDLNRTQKPLDLVEALVRSGCPEGGLVVDTCGGTGTTLVAADRSGRRCVYIDSDPVQVRAAASRLVRDRTESLK